MTHRTLYRLALSCRVMAKILHLLPALLVIAFFAFDSGPHVRVSLDQHSACQYLGSRGLQPAYQFYDCPWLVILDASYRGGI